MAHILIDKDGRCTCNCASKCVVKELNSGMSIRCTAEEISEAGHYLLRVKKRRFGGFDLLADQLHNVK